jgi:hypothetical protein
MSTTIDDAIMQRIAYLQDQLAGEDDPAYIRTFQTQIRILRTAQLDKLEELIAIRKKDLKACMNVIQADMVFAELDALEWLNRQIMTMMKKHV